MATSLRTCATHLDREGVRHHLDGEEAAIRVVLVTHHKCSDAGVTFPIPCPDVFEGETWIRLYHRDTGEEG